jgi:hypothetical protein
MMFQMLSVNLSKKNCTTISETVFVVCGGYSHYPSDLMDINISVIPSVFLFHLWFVLSSFSSSYLPPSPFSWNSFLAPIFPYFTRFVCSSFSAFSPVFLSHHMYMLVLSHHSSPLSLSGGRVDSLDFLSCDSVCHIFVTIPVTFLRRE